jgi:glycosyltransferase involved in cell wall biosynthesis
MDDAPIVSVIVAGRDEERYVDEAVGSILAQSFEGFELIFVDDASNDATAEIVRRRAGQDPRVTMIQNETCLGRAGARNVGLRRAVGELLVIHDADDLSPPNRLEVQKDYLDAHTDVDVLACPHEMIDEDGVFVARKRIADTPEELAQQLQRRCSFHHCAAMYRTAAVRAIGGYREGFQFVEDYDMLMRLVEQSRLDVLDVPTYRYRVVRSGASIGLLAEQRHQVIRTVQQFARERAETGDDSYEEYFARGRIPGFPDKLPPGKGERYHYILPKIAVGEGEYSTMFRLMWRGIRQQPTLLPKYAYLTFAACVRIGLQFTGLLNWFERKYLAK